MTDPEQMRNRIEELEEGLRPFAFVSTLANPAWPDEVLIYFTARGCDQHFTKLNMSRFRRAASLLEQKETDQDSLHVDETCKENGESFAQEAGERADSYLYHNPDSGWEISANHPVESGEVPDADHIEPISAQVHNLLTEAWSRPDTPPQAHGDVERIEYVTIPLATSAKEIRSEIGELTNWEFVPHAKDVEAWLHACVRLTTKSDNPPDGDAIARVAQAIRTKFPFNVMQDEPGMVGLSDAVCRNVAAAALSAMRPVSVDSVKLKEIRGRLEKSLDDFLAAFGC